MTSSTRYSCVRFLLARVGGGWDGETLAYKTDDEIANLTAERHTDVAQDITDLKAAGLWPLPKWLIERGLKLHGLDGMKEILDADLRARRTTYA